MKSLHSLTDGLDSFEGKSIEENANAQGIWQQWPWRSCPYFKGLVGFRGWSVADDPHPCPQPQLSH